LSPTSNTKSKGLGTGAVVGIVVAAVAASTALAALVTVVLLRRRHANYARAKLYGTTSCGGRHTLQFSIT
jgi:hypothetical protein